MTKTKKTKQKSNYIPKSQADKLKKKLNVLIDEKGVRNAFIAEKTGIYGQTITRFRNGEKTIMQETADKLEKLLKDYKF